MKIASIVAGTLLVGSFLVVSANEDLDAQIIAIQEAVTPEERLELVNEFKILLADMNADERQAAIEELRGTLEPLAEEGTGSMQTRTRTQTRTHASMEDGTENVDGDQLQTRTQTHAQEHLGTMSQTDQMNQMQQKNQMHQMQQKHVGTQAGTAVDHGFRPGH